MESRSVSIISLLSQTVPDEDIKEEIQKCISSGASVDGKDTRGWRPIHAAAFYGHDQCLELLLETDGTCTDLVGYAGESALLLACRKGNTRCVKQLLKHKANIDICTSEGFSPFYEAVSGGYTDIVQMLIESGVDINIPIYTGEVALHAASEKGNVEIVKILLKANAELQVFTEHHLSPMFLASQYGHSESLKLLLEAAKQKDLPNLVNERALDGATPLLLAAQEGHENCIKLLLQFGADANIPVTELNALPLHYAVFKKNFSCFQYLMPPVTNPAKILTCHSQMHPLTLLLEYQSTQILYSLKNMHINITTAKLPFRDDSVEYETYVRGWGFNSSASLPCHFLRDTEEQDSEKQSDFYCEVMKYMLDLGWSPNSTDGREIPPLLCLLSRGLWKETKMLLDHGACPNIRTSNFIGNLAGLMAVLADKCIITFVTKTGDKFDVGSRPRTLFRDQLVNFPQSEQARPLLKGKKIIGKFLLSILVSGGEVASCFNNLVGHDVGYLIDESIALDELGGMEDSHIILLLLIAFLFSQNICLSAEFKKCFEHLVHDWEASWKYITNVAESSKSLAHACRKEIVCHMIKSRLIPSVVVPKLEIPRVLKSYLLFKEYRPFYSSIDLLIKYLLDYFDESEEKVIHCSTFINGLNEDTNSQHFDIEEWPLL